MADAYKDAGDYVQAEGVLRIILASREKTNGPASPEVAATLGSIAVMCREQKRYAEAESLYQRALEIAEKSLAPNDPELAQLLNNIAYLYNEEQRYPEAEVLYQRCLAIREKAGDDWATATTLDNVAEVYEAEGKYAEAEAARSKWAAVLQTRLGAEHPVVAVALGRSAVVLRKAGEVAAAGEMEARAARIRAEHPKEMALFEEQMAHVRS